jgi:hypothetical protein
MDFYENNKEWLIPVSILLVGKLIDLVLPWFRSYLENNYLSHKQRKISILRTRYREVSKLRQKPVFSNKTSPYLLGLLLIGLSMGYLAGTIDKIAADFENYSRLVLDFSLIVSVVVLSFLAAFLLRWYQNTVDAVNFDRYRAKVLNRITKLGGDPKELLQIDKEIQLPK